MNTIKKLIKSVRHLLALAACAMALVGPPAADAADYAVQKTFVSFNGTATNDVNSISNLNAAIDVTQFTDFALQVLAKSTNAAVAGGISIVWETSLDGSNWPTYVTNNAATPHMQGWFNVPTTNNVTTLWTTNITVNSVGYWRIRTITNASSGSFTNFAITGYVKPKRTNRDF